MLIRLWATCSTMTSKGWWKIKSEGERRSVEYILADIVEHAKNMLRVWVYRKYIQKDNDSGIYRKYKV